MKGKKQQFEDVPRQEGDAALLLSGALRRLVEESVGGCLEDITEQRMGMCHQLSQIETRQQKSLYNDEHVQQRLGNLLAAHQLLDKAAQTNVLLGQEHFDERIIQPMVRSLFPMYDLIDDALEHRQNHPESEDVLQTVRDQLGEFLAIYDVCPFRHEPGETFDPKKMKPIQRVPVGKKRLDGHVAKSIRAGFQIGSDQLLRLETVALFKYQTPEGNLATLLHERNENNDDPRN